LRFFDKLGTKFVANFTGELLLECMYSFDRADIELKKLEFGTRNYNIVRYSSGIALTNQENISIDFS